MNGARVLFGGLLSLLACRATPSTVDPTVTLDPPSGKTRVIDFTTDEGTGMSVDVSPDGTWLAFDLLGQVYRLPIGGGEAINLTENSGPALNFHPAISPDGKRIAFASDRNGQLAIWTMAAEGGDVRLVFADPNTRLIQPTWAPDGKSIVAVRLYRTPGRGWHRQNRTLYRLPIGGGEPTALVEERLTQPDAPAFAPDGSSLYYQVSYSIDEGLGMLTAGHRIIRLDLGSGQTSNVRSGGPGEPGPAYREALLRGTYAGDVTGDEPAALTPKVSPDGKWLAFAREMPGETFEYRGHKMRPGTALWLRDLATGQERKLVPVATKDLSQINAQYAYRSFPGFAWMPDSKAIVLTLNGKLARVDAANGAVSAIPFNARVLRTVAEPVRGRIKIDDDSLRVRFLQWPATSPDGKRLAFVAVGKVWLMDLPNGTPRPLLDSTGPLMQLTPAWSPDGSSIAFASWNVDDRGHLWVVPAAGGRARRVTAESGEYFGPLWSPDGKWLAATRGPGPGPGVWNGWEQLNGWRLIKVPAAGGRTVDLAPTGARARAHLGPDGRLVYAYQENPLLASLELYRPFPRPDALAQGVRVRSIAWAGGASVDLLELPARRGLGNQPVLSPDAKWVAYDAAHDLFLSSVPQAAGVPKIPTDPNLPAEGRLRVGQRGGLFHRWRDAHTLEFVSGNRYLTHDVRSGRTDTTTIRLTVPRHVPKGSMALVGAKIVTVDSLGVIEQGTVVVRGARIACIGVCDTTGMDKVVDVRGKTIIPGLVDVHAHHTTGAEVIPNRRSESALDLAYGVTSIMDPATESESAFPLGEAIEAGLLAGPRSMSTAEFVISNGIAWTDPIEINSLDEARLQINRRADWGAVSIKNYRQAGRRQHQWLVQAARERRISLTSEGGPLYLDVGYAIDGQSGWEHFIADLPIYRDAATFFGRAGLVYSPTVIVAGVPNGSMQYFRPRADLLNEAKTRQWMPFYAVEAKIKQSPPIAIEEVAFPILAEGVADIVKAGGYAAIGEHGEQVGLGSHWELWAYATALTPLQALKVATYDGAYFIGGHEEFGSLRVGKLADLAILNADPLTDIRHSKDVAMVMKQGLLYDANTLEALWPERKPYGRIPWPIR